jgi:hypothetical protein
MLTATEVINDSHPTGLLPKNLIVGTIDPVYPPGGTNWQL